MVWAVHLGTGSWDTHQFRSAFKTTFSSSLGNLPDPDENCLKKVWDGIELVMCYDKAAKDLVFRTTVPDNSWFSIGFGKSMKNTDMISWFVDNETGRTVDYWSTNHKQPKEDIN